MLLAFKYGVCESFVRETFRSLDMAKHHMQDLMKKLGKKAGACILSLLFLMWFVSHCPHFTFLS